MKEAKDKFTVDMHNKKVGRPPDPNALTPAQRKKAQRERLAAAGKVSRTFDLSIELVQALDKFVQFKDEDRNEVVERILRDRLMRKR